MTADAFDLRHTCCRKSDDISVDDIVHLDKAEVDEIRDEERLLLRDFEILVAEVIAEFDEIGLSIMDFLQGPWYKRMLETLSRLDPYDEEYAKRAQSMGLRLEISENVLDRVSLLVGSRAE
ncbi:uncharacterized protein N7482_002203 [Penicillium canariense]|uniref:Uncharacterized protein n=1 Tax=Penicillium canariense TaxID=189055 RepID=A0A9W9IIK4_9EURO|nr:uncharacterized protein N7482_002203 [Penicillium canariense]KAJ5176326.1 hypothetical protein N7482_002203 [Penicillium canariense]